MPERIHPGLMRNLGEQLANAPAGGSLGVGARSGWVVVRLTNGSLAVGSFGGPLPTEEDVTKAIEEFRGQQVPYPQLGAIGQG
jgi:hypothetical protein